MYGTYTRLRVATFASNVDVVRAASKMLTRHGRTSRVLRVERHAFYRLMLEYHRKGQELAREHRLLQHRTPRWLEK